MFDSTQTTLKPAGPRNVKIFFSYIYLVIIRNIFKKNTRIHFNEYTTILAILNDGLNFK